MVGTMDEIVGRTTPSIGLTAYIEPTIMAPVEPALAKPSTAPLAEGLYRINTALGCRNAFWDAMNYENVAQITTSISMGSTPVLSNKLMTARAPM